MLPKERASERRNRSYIVGVTQSNSTRVYLFVAGALADALEAIAVKANLLHPSVAVDFTRRLLALFTDVMMSYSPLQELSLIHISEPTRPY